MNSQAAESSAQVLRHKFTAPGIPRGSIRRPRLDRLFHELLDAYSIVEVIAAPGSGKTVAAQLFASGCGRRLAWLTMDRSDVSASGLVFDLAAALGPLAGDAVSAMRQTLQTTGTAEEAAAILASSADGADALLVIDECQEIAASAEAASALDVFLEYVPERLRVLMLAREELPWPLQKRYIHGQIAQIGDTALNLTLDETVECARQLGASSETAERIFASTGGWAAGVAFGSRFGVDDEPNSRDLSAYFGHRVLFPLPEDEQRFLLDTSVTDVITRDVASALCGPGGQQLWSALSARHLPATSTTSSAIVIHSLFRSFLQQRLADTEPDRRARLLAAYARYLAAARQFKDATNVWISLGDLEQAHDTAVLALPTLFADADWAVIMRWLDAFGEPRVLSDPALVGAYVRAVHGLRQFERARTLVRRLDREDRLRAAIDLDPSLLATVAWAMLARPQEALRLLDKYPGDRRADVVRYMIEVAIGTHPVPPPDAHDLPDMERLLSWGLFLQGRLGELARMGPPADDATAILNPNVVLAPAFHENTETAAALWQRVPPEIRGRTHSQFIAAMIALSTGDHAEARQCLERAVADSQREGFSLQPVYEIFLGYLRVTDESPEAAVAWLEPILEELSRTGQTAYAEMAQCFLGLAYLRAERVTEALIILRETTASMVRCQRRLLLPMAAVGLSEAEARLGDAKAAATAAELAYRVSMMTCTFAILVQAVRLFPDVQRRQLALDPGESRWRRLVAAPSVRRRPLPAQPEAAGTTLVLQPFGRQRDLIVDGQPVRIGRTKILELVACLSLHPRGIDRFELQRQLFPEADQRSGGNHFRQIAHGLRHTTEVNLDRKGDLIRLPTSCDFTANDIESERILGSASALSGSERRARLEAGLALACGPYLVGSTLPWIEERRNYLDLVYEEARIELALLYLELGEPDAAREACETVLKTNRYSDPSYRILVGIERRVGSESSVLAVYRRATEALTELGLRPGDARQLLQRGIPRPTGPAFQH